ncbi:MAG: SRPBCC family protein [Acidobacteria bacterium]|nr:SRPBCC family protein [Acidobacteriota bacterium]
MYVLRCQLIAPVSIRDAFALFEDPRNLVRITPPWLGLRITTPEPLVMKAGAEIEYQLRWRGLPLGWKSLITEYEPPFYFTDEQISGPCRFWRHHHSLHPTPEGALITDEVQYALPLGWLGRLVHKFVVADQLKIIFRYRQEQMNEILCAGRARWTEPAITEIRPQSPPSGTANPGTRTHEVSSSPRR